jgi:hypothetical protein
MATRQEIKNDFNIDLDIAEQHPGRRKPHKNTYYINGTFAIVKLQDDTYMICSTDEHTLHLLSNYVWHKNAAGYIYSNGCSGYFHSKYYRRQHILQANHCIDHINRKKHDNRKCNIRQCDLSTNMRNKTIRNDNTSGKQGVFFYNNNWIATICNVGPQTRSYSVRRYGNETARQNAINKRIEWERLYGYYGQ